MSHKQKQQKRKICFPIMNRVHYARQIYLLDLLRRDPALKLQIVVGGSVLLEKYGDRHASAIKESGFDIGDELYNVIDGGTHIAMAKTAGLTALEFANSLYTLDSDIVLIRGDRFEQLAIAMVAAYMNKTIAHIEGGDVTGTIDESVRHAITKLAHIHFVTNEPARRRVVQMGEDPSMVFNVGSPDVEFVARTSKGISLSFLKQRGTGHNIDMHKPYLMVMFHPVTTDANNRTYAEILLETIDRLNMQTIWFWPNNDAGTNEIAKAIRVARELGNIKHDKIKFVTDVSPEEFSALLSRAACMVGNSSAGFKECSYVGVPVVNVGSRQQGRLRGAHIIDVPCDHAIITKAIKQQLAHGHYPSSDLYYKPNSSKNIVEILKTAPLYSQKIFYEA